MKSRNPFINYIPTISSEFVVSTPTITMCDSKQSTRKVSPKLSDKCKQPRYYINCQDNDSYKNLNEISLESKFSSIGTYLEKLDNRKESSANFVYKCFKDTTKESHDIH